MPRFPEYLTKSQFCARYEAKGRYRAYLSGIPINIIIQPDAAFTGLKAFLEQATPVAANNRRGT